MGELRAAVVLTTIFDASVLEAYHTNFQAHGRLDQVEVILIPDLKTPAAAGAKCRELSEKGLPCQCPSIEEQEEFLESVGLPAHLVPHNSDNRRNVGFLMALASGADFLISLDDDNYPRAGEDFFAGHAVVAEPDAEHTIVEAPGGFFNLCDLLEKSDPGVIYPRGYPYYARHDERPALRKRGRASVHINAGLWLGDPDVDAITWLVAAPRVTAFHGESVVLERDTWAPINTQNTALRREAVPAYWFVKMGYPLGGTMIDRYGDIFSGYFAEACAKHVGGYLRAGSPAADHRRNSHNHMRDAAREWGCILVLEELLPWLRTARLSGSTYLEAYLSLSHELEDAAERFQGSLWNDASRAWFHQMAHYMRAWLKACKAITRGSSVSG